MKTFSVSILGCRVNHYEGLQIARVLESRGLTQVSAPNGDIRVIHTCSVTSHAAKDSRQTVRRATKLPVIGQTDEPSDIAPTGARVIVTGCWATSDRAAAEAMPGVDAVITNHDDLNSRLAHLLTQWTPPKPLATLPILQHLIHSAAPTHQRAFLKVQDGCDAHCTYCIIPQLRPQLWTKPIEETVAEAKSLVAAGHREIVLTGIFLGAYGQETALRRHQSRETSKPIAELIRALCTQVPNLPRLRLSSLEPGDLDAYLIAEMQNHPQIVPHFHLPLQSGSDAVLRKMNRQYNRSQFLDMVKMVNDSFDRPAITTDIIVGFPDETDAEFEQTLDVVDRAKFIHTHAFTYSPRPKTAAARWTTKFIDARVANHRIHLLNARALEHSFAFRKQFIGEQMSVITERVSDSTKRYRRGRCERYFAVSYEGLHLAGELVSVEIETVTQEGTVGRIGTNSSSLS